MANWTKSFSNNSTVISVSDKGAVKVETNGKFKGCLMPSVVLDILALDRDTQAALFECIIEAQSEGKAAKQADKDNQYLAKKIAQANEKHQKTMLALQEQLAMLQAKGLTVVK